MTLTRSVVLLALILPSLAAADAVSVGLNGRGQLGKTLPSIEIAIHERIAGFKVTLTRSDGKKLELEGGGKPGQVRRIELQQPEGRFHYTGELTVVFPNAEPASMPMDFDAELWGPLKLTLDKKDVDLANRTVRLRANRPVVKAEVKVLMDTGAYAMDREIPVDNESAGAPFEITWPKDEGRVMKIAIRAFDASTFYDGVEISPWQVDIPHEELNFDSGKWDIRPDEAQKLQQSLQRIADAVRKYGHLATLRLYIAGHTDTVGDAASNRTLSLNRAKAIGAWFKKRGLRIPIFYEGFGEQALRVGTEDETDEPKNRRAEYIIAIDDPTLERTPFPPNWRKL